MNGNLKQGLKRLPFVKRIISSHLYRAAYYWIAVLRHRLVLKFGPRPELEAFTRFYRTPHQFDALLGPALEFLKPEELGRPVRIVVLACSTGAEPYSIASALVNGRPEVPFEMIAGDINATLVEKCKQGVYTEAEVFSNELMTDTWVKQLFESSQTDAPGQEYRIRPEISRHIEFACLDALDPELVTVTGKADIVFLQNVLLNLRPDIAEKMLVNILSLLRERTVLFLDGVDIHQRVELTSRYGLTPLDYEVETIHKEVWRIRKDGWPGLYWGIEPYWPQRKDTLSRYATVYLYERS